MNRGLPSAGRLSLMCSQLQLDFIAALESRRKVRENPKKFKKSPVEQLEKRLMTSLEIIEKEFQKIFEEIDEVFRSTSDEEFIDDSTQVSDDSDSEPEYLTSSSELSENEEFVSSEEDSDDEIEILQD